MRQGSRALDAPNRPSRLHAGSAFWRRLAYLGARYGSRSWIRYSPPVFGLAFATALPHQRAAVRKNLRLILGPRGAPEEALDIAKTFSHYACCLAESLGSERPEALRACRRIHGEEHLKAALGNPRGILIVTAHTGAWDAAARLLAEDSQRKVAVVMLREKDATARELHDTVRKRTGVQVIHIGEHPLDALPLLRHLRDGGIAAIQLDRVPHGARALDVRIFGQSFAIPRGPFALAALAKVPLLPLFVRRVGHFDYELRATPMLQVPRRASEEELREVAQKAAKEMERFLRSAPTQWFHFDD